MALRRPLVLHPSGGYVENLPDGDYLESAGDWKDSVRLATAAALPAVTAAGSGLGKTLTANANGALSVDGVATVAGNRVLVKNQASGADNGLYVVTDAGSAGTPFVLTRATDADNSAELTSGMSVWVSAGTTHGNQGWTCTTNDPITLDTTSLTFSQSSSVVAYTFDAGLLHSGGSVTVEVDTGAAAQAAGNGGGSSGLEFDAAGAAGKLRAAVHATGGLERSGTGLAAKLNGTSIATGASGLSVAHSPQTRNGFLASEALTAFHPVAMSTTANRVVQARGNDDDRAKVVGITTVAAAAGGDPIEVVQEGVLVGALSGATPRDVFYLAPGGGLTAANTYPVGNTHLVQIGIAKNATDLIVQINHIGKK